MSPLNFKHLRYFWMVAKTESIASAAAPLHLTPQSISGQLTEFADVLGVELFRRVGRNLEVTDTGRRILSYAEDIFSTGDELMEPVRDKTLTKSMSFRVGCADSLSKLIACRLLAPAMQLSCDVSLTQPFRYTGVLVVTHRSILGSSVHPIRGRETGIVPFSLR